MGETSNALLDAEAYRLCNAERYDRGVARRDTRAAIAACQLIKPDQWALLLVAIVAALMIPSWPALSANTDIII